MRKLAPTPARLEAFSDGVIAVIITIMVLDIKVPHGDGLEGLQEMGHPLAVYFLSFFFSGTYWINHQALVRRVSRAGHSMQSANLAFLFCLSLLPLSTAYVVDKHLSGFAVAVYCASLLIVALSFMALRLTVHFHLNRRAALDAEDRKGLRNHCLSILFYLICIGAAFYYPIVVLASTALLTLIWVVPNLSFGTLKDVGDDGTTVAENED